MSDEEKARRKAERRKAKRKVRGKAYLAGNLYVKGCHSFSEVYLCIHFSAVENVRSRSKISKITMLNR